MCFQLSAKKISLHKPHAFILKKNCEFTFCDNLEKAKIYAHCVFSEYRTQLLWWTALNIDG